MIPTVESDHNNITPEKHGDYNARSEQVLGIIRNGGGFKPNEELTRKKSGPRPRDGYRAAAAKKTRLEPQVSAHLQLASVGDRVGDDAVVAITLHGAITI